MKDVQNTSLTSFYGHKRLANVWLQLDSDKRKNLHFIIFYDLELVKAKKEIYCVFTRHESFQLMLKSVPAI